MLIAVLVILPDLTACTSAPPAPEPTYAYEGKQLTLQEFRELADQKANPGARLAFARLIVTRRPSGTTIDEARGIFQQLAETGDMQAEISLAHLDLWVMGDGADAAAWYQKAADQGSAAADAELAYMYENGLGVKKDKEKAGDFFQKSRGDPQGQFELFALQVEVAINNQKYYPKEAIIAGLTGAVTAQYDYYGGGKATNISIMYSSGNRFLDKAAMDAVKNATLPALPDILKGVNHFIIQMNFSLGHR